MKDSGKMELEKDLESHCGKMICFMKAIGYKINFTGMEGYFIQKEMFILVNFYKDLQLVKASLFIMMAVNIQGLFIKIYLTVSVLSTNQMVVYMKVNLTMV